MGDLVFNRALGRVVEFYSRVDNNDPANSAIVIVAINTTATDAVLKDLDDLAAILADANTAEVTNTNYARIVLSDSELAAYAPDDGADEVNLDIPDSAWTAVAAGDAWTDLVVCYDPDTTGGTDADLIPLTLHDFAITPDGSDINANVPATGFFNAS